MVEAERLNQITEGIIGAAIEVRRASALSAAKHLT